MLVSFNCRLAFAGQWLLTHDCGCSRLRAVDPMRAVIQTTSRNFKWPATGLSMHLE